MLALSALENWHIKAPDVWSAYLYGKLKEEIYIKQPEGFRIPGQEHKVLCLLHALYGLKQAGLTWWETLNGSMKDFGFEHLKSNADIFLFWKKNTSIVVAVIYVNDALFYGPTKDLEDEVKDAFMHKWQCRDLGPAKEFLHMRIQRNGSKILIDQYAYLEKVLERFGMTNARSATTPLPQGYYPLFYNGQVDSEVWSHFQQVIGSLLYIMLDTWPDITYAVTALSQHTAKPSQEHLDKALYICWYLLGIYFYSLVFDGASWAGLITFTNSDWTSDPNTHHSQTGWIIKIANCIFSWKLQQQQQIAYFSTEAEYIALSDCSKQVVWLWSLLEELGY